MNRSSIPGLVNWWIRRRVYFLAACDTLEDQSDQVDMDDAESDLSTDDGDLIEVLEPFQVWRCRCPQPTWRMPLGPTESEFRCFECLGAHRDQGAHFPFQIPRRVSSE